MKREPQPILPPADGNSVVDRMFERGIDPVGIKGELGSFYPVGTRPNGDVMLLSGEAQFRFVRAERIR